MDELTSLGFWGLSCAHSTENEAFRLRRSKEIDGISETTY